MTHDLHHQHHGRGPAAALASAWNALCCLPATQPWLWLVRSAPVEAAPAIGLGVVRETWVAVGQGGPLAYLDDKTLPFPLFQGQP